MHRLKSNKQLYFLAASDSLFPNFVNEDGRLHTQSSENLPLMTWPDGSWCHPANSFMRELMEKGLSRRNRGGTLAVVAAHISHLLRYCWKQRCDLIELNDNQFIEFMHDLNVELKSGDPSKKKRDANTVIQIGRNCLELLDCIARHSGNDRLLGREGQIRAWIQEHQFQPKISGRTIRVKSVRHWNHPAFPNPSPQKKRLPISTGNIERMRKVIGSISTTSHQRVRRHTMLKLLEVTGARRAEIALITVASVIEAANMEFPMLRIPTLKKRSGTIQYRYIPINRPDLLFVMQYVEMHRRGIVRRNLKGKQDHGILLVNGRTGDALKPCTISDEISRLANAAGIKEKVCPHMFRHRFLTKLFVALIEQHTIENSDEFRRLLLDGEGLKRKVAEWTGHSNLDSLDRYIQLAFDEVNNYKKSYNIVNAGLILDSFVGTLDAELDAIESEEQLSVIRERLKAQIEQVKADLGRAK